MANGSASILTDEQLLVLIQDEDDYAAFAELFRRYWQPLITAAGKRVGTLHAAEELVQDVFVSLYRRRESIVVATSVSAYLNAALRNQVFKTYRSHQMHQRYLAHQTHASASVPDAPDALLEAKQLREEVLRVARQMPQKCQEAFLLSRFEQLTHTEIAERMGISVHTVKRHINRAMTILREELKDVEFPLILIFLLSR